MNNAQVRQTLETLLKPFFGRPVAYRGQGWADWHYGRLGVQTEQLWNRLSGEVRWGCIVRLKDGYTSITDETLRMSPDLFIREVTPDEFRTMPWLDGG